MDLFSDSRYFIVRMNHKNESFTFVKDYTLLGDDCITDVKHSFIYPCCFIGDSFDAAFTVHLFNRYLRNYHPFDDYEYFSFPLSCDKLFGSEEYDKWLKT